MATQALLLLAFLIFPSALGLSKDGLYPYTGGGAETLQVDQNGQLTSAEVQLKTPINFYDKVYNSIFVNGNGVLSFIRSMQRFFNIAFPLDDPVIAPLYTHVDTRASGTIYHSETDNPEVLSRVGGMVRSAFKNTENFEPTHVFLATWLDVGYYNEKSDKVNTYQVVISSNGTHSYIELLYPNGGIQWIQGESHPNGLPDAKAQAGFMSEGRMYTLKGSGTDQIQNIDKWSNVNRPGQWVFQIGPVPEGQNIKPPNNIDMVNKMFPDSNIQMDQTCMTGATTCHSKATCIDYEYGFCCSCKPGFFGNGKSCQPNDLPLRVIGKVSGRINGEDLPSRDLQCYVQTKDGRTYTALSRIPESVGQDFQLLGTLGGVIGWLFAKPMGEIKNGYQLTGGLFNHTAELVYDSTGSRITIKSIYLGLDVFGQLKMEADIQGTLPRLPPDSRVDYGDYEEVYTSNRRGALRSHSSRKYKLSGNPTEYPFTVDQTITYQDCTHVKPSGDNTTKLKFSRGLTTYEAREGIIRFAMNTKMTPLEEEDPCIQGRETCGEHSSCVVDGDDFRCICNTGYQQLYEEDGTANCVDINECTAGYHLCSPDAQCINNEGSHTCQCKPGFSGDGRICERLGSCDDTRCGEYEECRMINEQPVCSCVPGFVKSDQGCFPAEDPCNLANNCSPQGECTYDHQKQSHVCLCLPGFVGDGYNCYAEQSPEPNCANGVCWCPPEWEVRDNACVRSQSQNLGSSTSGPHRDHACSDHSECGQNEICSYNPSKSRYECTCNPGFDMVNGQCAVADCSTNPSQCHVNAQCITTIGEGYKCVCMPGFHGDGINQCVEDHIGCNVVNNCGSNAVCGYNQTSANYACMCLPGFYGDGFICKPQASCRQNPEYCSREATCLPVTPSHFACVCKEGFHGDGVECKPKPKHAANFLLVNQGMANLRIPYFPTAVYPGSPINLAYSQMAIAIDIDCPNGTAYSSDITGAKIISLTYNGSSVQTFMTDVSSPEGISIDWVSRNLFWTDSGRGTIEVASLETKKRKVLISEGLVNPRGIAVHPYRGKIFWSDWNRMTPKIEWSNEDGTQREVFLQGESVKLPNSLAIDWTTDELCWADAGTFTISCTPIDNKRVHVIEKDLAYPFGLAISADNYYWTDWKTHKIEAISKHTSERLKSLPIPPGGSGKLYGITSVPEQCPRLSNVCQYENGRCHKDQLCLPDGRGGRTCACADNTTGPCTESRS
ncbi:nidogen-2 isoform X5 [Diachasma alloeum]|uniref:nidogen-2 isoform X5 n=1 Tax=Diachasma alloeum TaxID=454923 RepID=UPI00073834A0|nr:nidogen-2 isoform X5 [Diachasma alloeum]